jgi:fumarate hydratase class II
MTIRTKKDTVVEMEVPEGIYCGSQTARSLLNFDIGIEKIPQELIVSFGPSKKDAAVTLGFLSDEEFDSIVVPAKTTGPQKPDIEKPGRTAKS